MARGINTDSRTLNSLKNIGTGVLSQIVVAALSFISRTVFINYLAIEYLGLNGLFGSILSLLGLAELGVGSAFIYSLYKPLADGNEQLITAILKLYKRVYIIIGLSVFVLGALLVPFLDQLIPEKPEAVTESIVLIYFFFLFNTASTYFFTYKVSLLNADQRNYVVSLNFTVFTIVRYVLQIVVLMVTHNFIWYLTVQLVFQLLANFSISEITNRYYPFIKKQSHLKVPKDITKEIITNTKATFLVKVSGIIVNSTDNLFINYFAGLALIGIFSNYSMLIALAGTFILQVFNNLTASIAQVNTKESKEKQFEIFKVINFLNFWIYGAGAILFVALANDFVKVWIGDTFILPTSISIIIAINFFLVGMQNAVWTFKSTYGLFRYGMWLVVGTAVLNIVLSFFFGHLYGLFGILLASAVARMVTNVWYDPFIVFKKGLQQHPVIYLKKYLKYVVALGFAYVGTHYLTNLFDFNALVSLILNTLVCVVLVNLIFFLFFRRSDEFILSKGILIKGINMLKRR